LPKQEFMERALTLWKKLDLPPITPQPPWHGYSLGDWDAHYDIYARTAGGRTRRIASTTRHTLRFHGRAGERYVFFTVAVDRAGNREARPVNATTRVARGAR
jgi:hypothetical protein